MLGIPLNPSCVSLTCDRRARASVLKDATVFLKNVRYNTEKVQFSPVSIIQELGREHFETDPIFERAARANRLEEWERLGIPPIFIANINGNWWHLIGEGQTRLNSAIKIQNYTTDVICVPVWDITEFVDQTNIRNTPNYLRPPLPLRPGTNLAQWNLCVESPISGGLRPIPSEDAFCGFS